MGKNGSNNNNNNDKNESLREQYEGSAQQKLAVAFVLEEDEDFSKSADCDSLAQEDGNEEENLEENEEEEEEVAVEETSDGHVQECQNATTRCFAAVGVQILDESSESLDNGFDKSSYPALQRTRDIEWGPGAYAMPGTSVPDNDNRDINCEVMNDSRGTLNASPSEGTSGSEDMAVIAIDATVVESTTVPHFLYQDESMLEEAVDVRPLPERRKSAVSSPARKEISKITFFLLSLLVLGTTAAIGLIFGRNADTSNADKNALGAQQKDTQVNKEIKYALFAEDLLEESTEKEILECDASTSPVCLANAWMVQDPKLETHSAWKKIQRFSLAAFYYATKGDDWFHNDDWLSYNVPECQWYTSSKNYPCDEEGKMTILDLKSNNLQGNIPRAAGVPSLKILDLSNNELVGQLPPVADGRTVEEYILSNNKLAGMIMVDGGFRVSPYIRVIKFDGNQLEGHYGLFLPFLSKTEVFDIGGNLFSGPIPTQFGSMQKLTSLSLRDNLFSGTLPTQLEHLQLLVTLDISGNTLVTGTIPESFGSSLKSLRKFDVADTLLSGSIPMTFCNRTEPTQEISIVANCSRVQCCSH